MLKIFKRLLVFVLPQVFVLAAADVSLANDQTFLPANACAPTWNLSNVQFDGFGSAVNSTSNMEFVVCAIGQDHALDSNDDVRIYFWDNNSANWQDFDCSAYEVSNDWGTVYYTGFKYGCATPGGCNNQPNMNYTGESYISLVDISHGGAFSTAIYCGVPGNYSAMKSIFLDE